MSFWKNLFGGGSSNAEIEKDVGGELKTYRFVRADRMSSRDDLIVLALSKGRQIIDEQGEGIFR
jgi:hypothetical protein